MQWRGHKVIGDKVGPYTLVRLLGQGGFGDVWLAERATEVLTTQVALKLPRLMDAEYGAVRQEARIWQRASGHPNIVPVLDADLYDGQVVIASEFIAGGTLADLLKSSERGALDISVTIPLMEGVLSGLSHLHSAGLAHRDLKPDNVLLQAGIPRLTDFGLARVVASQNLSEQLSGSPHYMAPETFIGAYSPASDLWGAGVILYEMLSGLLPFDRPDLMQIICAIREHDPAPLPRHIPPGLRAIVDRLLSRAPEDRFPSALETLAALRGCRQDRVILSAAPVSGEPEIGAPAPAPANAEHPEPWYVQLMGTLRMRQGGGSAVPLPTRRSAAMLARLAFEPGREFRREELMEMLWPGATEEQQRNNMSVELNRLRSCLKMPGVPGKEVLAGVNTVCLDPRFVNSDVNRLRVLARSARASEVPAERAALLQEAVALYEPEFLTEYDQKWISPAREEMARLHIELAEKLIADLGRLGEHERATETARALVEQDQYAEERHGLLIFALVQAGRPCDAADHFETMLRLWQGEYGALPGPRALKLGEEARRRCAAKPALEEKTPGHNGPVVPESFFPILGREQEVTRLKTLLRDPIIRLVTLTGAGGSGKTRLAMEVAHELAQPLSGAVWFVPLADLNERTAIVDSMRDILGAPPNPGIPVLEQVTQLLSKQPSLLVLDNFEHLADSTADLVRAILEQASSLKCLVTSQRNLQLSIEHIHEVRPLPLPEPPTTPGAARQPKDITQYACIRLFEDRARRVRPEFTLTPENARAVVEICRRLDGIPLAIELAAAWAKVLTPVQMLTKIDTILVSRERDRSDRHHSLEAVIQASMDRLSAEQRRFLLRAAVFRGGWTVEAAEDICEDPLAMSHLADLQEASLVLVEQRSETMRYRMLEPLREYAVRRLSEQGERQRVTEHHCRFFLRMATEAAAGLAGPDYGYWLQRIDDDLANLSLALKAADAPRALEAAADLHKYWIGRGRIVQGRDWLENTLAAIGDLPTEVHGRVLLAAGILAWLAGDIAGARARLSSSLATCQSLADERGSVKALANLANIGSQQGDVETAQRDHEASLIVSRRLGDPWLTATILANYGTFCQQIGDSKTAKQCLDEALSLHNRLENEPGKADVLHNLAGVAQMQQDYGYALQCIVECLEIRERLGDFSRIPQALMLVAIIAVALGEYAGAIRLFASAEGAFKSLDLAQAPIETEQCLPYVRQAELTMSEAELTNLRTKGRSMSVSEAVRSAIAEAKLWMETR